MERCRAQSSGQRAQDRPGYIPNRVDGALVGNARTPQPIYEVQLRFHLKRGGGEKDDPAPLRLVVEDVDDFRHGCSLSLSLEMRIMPHAKPAAQPPAVKDAVPQTTILAQRMPEPRIAGAATGAMKVGFLLRGAFDRATSEVQDIVRIKEMIDTGEYKAIVADAMKGMPALAKMEPVDAFLRLLRTSRETYDRRLKEIDLLGPDAVETLRQMHIPYRDIRMLGNASPEVRRQAKALAEMGDRAAIDALLSKLTDVIEEKADVLTRLKDQEHATVIAENRAEKAKDLLVKKEEDMRDLKAQVRMLQQGEAFTDQEVIDACRMAREQFDRGVAILKRLAAKMKANPEVATRVEIVVNEVLGPLTNLKRECMAASDFGK